MPPTQRPELPSLPDARAVAERAGVSTATVSRALSGGARVRPETRAAVLRAADELGYRQNAAARALTTRKFSAVGAIIPNLENEVFVRALAAFQLGLRQAGYTLVVASSDYDIETELREVSFLAQRGIDGLMLVGDIHDDALYDRLTRYQIPLVQCFSLSASRDCVGFDNAVAARRGADHLLDLGHRVIAVVTGTRKHNDRSGPRAEGVRQALAARGLALRSEHDLVVSHGVSAGREAAAQILSLKGPRPTAIICGTDQLALGVINEAQTQGLEIPRDLSVVGFNDSDYAAVLSPALTTLRVDAAKIGRIACERLICRMSGTATVRLTRLDPELIIRDTTAPPPV